MELEILFLGSDGGERRKPLYPLCVKPHLPGVLSHPKPSCLYFPTPRHSPVGSPLLCSVRGDSASAAERWGGINSEREEPAPAQHSLASIHPPSSFPGENPCQHPKKTLASPPIIPPGRYRHGGHRRRPNGLENCSVWMVYSRNIDGSAGFGAGLEILENCSMWFIQKESMGLVGSGNPGKLQSLDGLLQKY